MASNTLSNVRLQLRYDTYFNWMNKDPILLAGEIAVAEMTGRHTLSNSDDTPTFTPPAIGVKIGNGHSYFSELPWIQAVAADVYNWAKKATKPNYSADEISGLAEYIEQHTEGSGGSSGSSGGGAYRIIFDSINNKYILQQYNESIEQWENTSSEINFTSVLNRIETIENWANGAYTNIGNIEVPMVAYIQEIVTTFIGQLDVNDNAIEHQFITSVSETNGKINVIRSTIKANDITDGILPISHGGTGISEINYNEILIGGTRGNFVKGQITNIVDSNETTEIPTTGALITYVTNATAGLTSTMHFIGEASVPINETNSRVDPQIDGYDFRKVQAGDVILANNKQEYVWTGSVWRLLGDEGSYAIKGSITDADISIEANISQTKISNLSQSLNSKVDKVEGKELSTNDYTNEEKTKLFGIETGAQVNIINGITLNGITQIPDNNTKIVALTIKEFSDEYKTKLNSIQEGAQVNTIETVYLNEKQILPDNNKRIDLIVREYPKEDENKLKTIQEGAQVNVIERIKFDNIEILPDKDKIISITSNPHTEHENIIEHITLNGTEQVPNNKVVALNIDQNFIKGAEIPSANNSKESITITQQKLQLARVAASGDIVDLQQTSDTYILLDCGSSTTVI